MPSRFVSKHIKQMKRTTLFKITKINGLCGSMLELTSKLNSTVSLKLSWINRLERTATARKDFLESNHLDLGAWSVQLRAPYSASAKARHPEFSAYTYIYVSLFGHVMPS